MTAPSYPIGTLADMAKVPPEAWPRMLAELPVMLAQIRNLQVVVDVTNEAVGMEALRYGLLNCNWVDDDAQTITGKIEFGDGSQSLSFEQKFDVPGESA